MYFAELVYTALEVDASLTQDEVISVDGASGIDPEEAMASAQESRRPRVP